jgi:hypothetical protein
MEEGPSTSVLEPQTPAEVSTLDSGFDAIYQILNLQ